MKKKVLKRVPPGDKWAEFEAHLVNKNEKTNEIVGETLTKALNFIYKKYDVRIFEVDAGNGIVSIDDGTKETIIDEDVNSLYGDE